MASCFKDWLNCMRRCSRLPGAIDQVACAADCDLDLARCVRDSLLLTSAEDALVLARTIKSGFSLPLELLVKDEPGTAVDPCGNFNGMVDKAYEGKPLGEIAEAPVSAIKGVSAADAKILAESFNIKTVRDFANHEFAKYARSIVAQADSDDC